MQLLIHLQHRFSLSRLPTPLMWSWSRGELLRSLLPRMGAEFSPPPPAPPSPSAELREPAGERNFLGAPDGTLRLPTELSRAGLTQSGDTDTRGCGGGGAPCLPALRLGEGWGQWGQEDGVHRGTISARAKEVFPSTYRFGHPTRRECQGWAGSSPAKPWQIQDSNPCPGAAGAWVAVGGRGWHSPAVNPGHGASSAYMPPTAQSGSPQRCLTIRRM